MTKKSDDKRNAKTKQASKKPVKKKKAPTGAKAAADAVVKDQQSETNPAAIKKNEQKALKALIKKGKEQGSLTYDEINQALPNEMMSSEMIDDTLMMFDDMDIEIIETDDDLNEKETTPAKKSTLNKTVAAVNPRSCRDRAQPPTSSRLWILLAR